MMHDPFSPSFLSDPYPSYATLRRDAPCHHEPTRDVWMVSRHADVMSVLRDARSFSSSGGAGYVRVDDPERGGILIATDPPRHTGLRRVVQHAFTARTNELAARIESLSTSLVERAMEKGTIDVIRDLAEPLPVAITADLLGLDPETSDSFATWSDAVFRTMGPMDDAEGASVGASIEGLVGYLMPIVQERRWIAGGLADTIFGGVERGTFTFGEAFSLMVSLFAAGIDTTTNAIGNGLAALADHPAAFDAIRRAPERISPAVEEMLRYDAPIQAFFRTAVVDRVIAGTTIPAGARVMALFGSANRDPARYVDPDRFDVDRDASDHMAFGAGIHLCLGAPLARLEMQAVLRALVTNARELVPDGPRLRRDRTTVRGYERLPLALAR